MENKNIEMWMVYSNEEGVILITDDYDEAVLTYESEKERTNDWCNQNLEFCGDESIILAKVQKHFFYRDMNEKELNNLRNDMEDEFDEESNYGILDEIKYKI